MEINDKIFYIEQEWIFEKDLGSKVLLSKEIVVEDDDQEPWGDVVYIIVEKKYVGDKPFNPQGLEWYKKQLDIYKDKIAASRDLDSRIQKNAQAIKALLAKLQKQSPSLQRISDFLDDKITHYVYRKWGNVAVIKRDDARCDCTRENHKLLSLYGSSKGDLQWRLQQYSDSSGSSCEVWPCLSFGEAKKKANELVVEMLKEGRRIDYKQLPPEIDMTKELRAYIEQQKTKEKTNRQAEIEELKEKIKGLQGQ